MIFPFGAHTPENNAAGSLAGKVQQKQTAASRLRKTASMLEMGQSARHNQDGISRGNNHEPTAVDRTRNKTRSLSATSKKAGQNDNISSSAYSSDSANTSGNSNAHRGEGQQDDLSKSRKNSETTPTISKPDHKRPLRRRASVAAGMNASPSLNKTSDPKNAPQQHGKMNRQQVIQRTREQGEREFKSVEAKRELEKKLMKLKKELQRANTLTKAADAERKTAEKGIKKAQERLISVEHQDNEDLSQLIKSLHSDLAEARAREGRALAALERFKAARLIGSTMTKATQTGEGEEGGVIGGTKTIALQTDETGDTRGSESGGGGKQDDGDDEKDPMDGVDGDLARRFRGKKSGGRRNGGKKSQRNQPPKMSGKKWVQAAQFWQEQLPGGDGLLHFARKFKAKDVPTHSVLRTMMLVRSVIEDKMRGDDHEREESMQEYLGEWSLNKYGLMSIACKEHAKMLVSVRVHSNSAVHERISIFNRMVGISRPYPKVLTNCVLFLWNNLRPRFDPSNKARDKDDLSAYIATSYCVEAVDAVFGKLRPKCSYFLSETQRSRLIKRIWKLEKQAHHKSHGRHQLCASDVVGIFVSEWEQESNRVDQLLRALFEAADVNGDGELTLHEFQHTIDFVEHTNKTGHAFASSLSSQQNPEEQRTFAKSSCVKTFHPQQTLRSNLMSILKNNFSLCSHQACA